MKKYLAILLAFSCLAVSFIHLGQLENYVSQMVPNYVTRDNTPTDNPISNPGATLGRVLFYDKKLSANNTISCGSCHIQEFGFSDTAAFSMGLNGGRTGKHSMRLAYGRFSDERRYFWDERAESLEAQTTMPVQDEIEMGFSGHNGQPGFDSLVRKLASTSYYPTLFSFVYGDTAISELRIKKALGQFIRSIYSFDSKFDQGLAATSGNLNAPFPNFSMQENMGKNLYLAPPPQGGGCQGCHRAPDFSIDPITRNNGVPMNPVQTAPPDYNVTRAPSLRDLVNPQGQLNGAMMHNAVFTNLRAVVDHYAQIPNDPDNFNLDPRLTGPGSNLNLNPQQKDAIAAFLRTLTSNQIYTNRKWSNPFDPEGNLQIITLSKAKSTPVNASIWPNPANHEVHIGLPNENFTVKISDIQGKEIMRATGRAKVSLSVNNLPSGRYQVQIATEQRQFLQRSLLVSH